MPQIEYIAILKKAWQIAWEKKYLWWFGFFVALLGTGGMNFSLNDQEKTDLAKSQAGKDIVNFISTHHEAIMILLGIAMIIILLFVILGIIGRGALIKSIDSEIKGQSLNFKAGFGEGRRYAGRIFLLGLTLGLGIFFTLIILAIPVIFFFVNHSYILGALLGILAVFIFIPLMILTSFLRIFGQLYLILGDLGVFASFESAYNLFRKNIFSSVIMGLILWPVSLAAALAVISAAILIAIIFLAIGFLLSFFLGKIGIIIAAVPGVLSLLAVIFFTRAVWEAYAQTVWILFFFEIAKPKILEAALEVEEGKEKTSIPTIEPVITSKIDK
jgi:hypothetical protein